MADESTQSALGQAFVDVRASLKNLPADLEQAKGIVENKVSEINSSVAKIGSDLNNALVPQNATRAFGFWAQYTDATKSASTATGGLVGQVVELATGLGGITAATGAVAVLTGLVAAVISFAPIAAKTGNEIADLGDKLNLTAQPVSLLRAAVTAAGGDINSFGNTLLNLDKRVETNGDQVHSALKQLGIDSQQFLALPLDQRAIEISEAWKKLPPNINEAALAQKLFGESGTQQLAVLKAPLDDLISRARDLGLAWSDQDVKAAQQFQQETNLLDQSVERLKERIGSAMLPVLTDLVEGLTKDKELMADLQVVAGLTAQGLGLVANALELIAKTDLSELKWIVEHAGVVSSALNFTPGGAGMGDIVRQMGLFKDAIDGVSKSLDDGQPKAANFRTDINLATDTVVLGAARMAAAKAELAGLSATTKQSMTDDLKLGDSVKEVAGNYDLSTDAVKLFKEQLTQQTEAAREAAEAEKQHQKNLAEVAAATTTVSDATKARIIELDKLHVTEKAIADDTGANVVQIRQVIAASTEAEAADKRRQKSLDDLNSSASQLTDTQRGEINALLILGKSEDEIAVKLDVTKQQVRDVAREEKNRADASKQNAADIKKGIEDTLKAVQAYQRAYQENFRILADADRDYEATHDERTLTSYQAQKKAIEDWGAQQKAQLNTTADNWKSAWDKIDRDVVEHIKALGPPSAELFDNLGTDLQRIAQVGDGTFSHILGGAGQALSELAQLERTGQTVSHGLSEITGGSAKRGWMDLASGIATAAAAAAQFGSAIDKATAGERAAGGAAEGAQIGGSLGGGYGALAGTVIGALIGAFHTPEWVKIMGDVGSQWGDYISEALARSIQNNESVIKQSIMQTLPKGSDPRFEVAPTEQKLGIDQMLAGEALSLDQILSQNGRIFDTAALVKYQSAIDQLFKLQVLGFQAGAAAASELKTLITQFGEQAVQDGTLWSKEFDDLVARARAAGVAIDEINKLVAGQLTNAQTGLNTALGVTGDAQKQLAEDQADSATLRGQLDTSQISDLAKIEDLKKKIAGADAAPAAAYQQQIDSLLGGQDSLLDQIEKLNDDMDVQQKIIDATSIKSEAAAQAIAGSIFGIVSANQKAGMSWGEALKAAEPAIDALEKQMQAAGYSGGAVFDFLHGQLDLFNDAVAGPALTALEGYRQAVLGLANAGKLDQDSFAALEGQIGSTYDELVAQGKDGPALLAAMQDPLQTAWELEQKFGYQADDATQSLIDQAEKAGLVGEAHKSWTDQLLDVLGRIADALDGPNGIGAAAKNAADQTADAFNGMHIDPVHVRVQYDDDGQPTSRGQQGQDLGDGDSGLDPAVPHAAVGAVISSPMQLVAGEAGPEAIVPLDRYNAMFSRMDRDAGKSPSQVIYNNTLRIDSLQSWDSEDILRNGPELTHAFFDSVENNRSGGAPVSFQTRFGNLVSTTQPGGRA